MEKDFNNNNEFKKRALLVIGMFGFISLFGDIIYESARSVYGPYTKLINMDIAFVGFITGIAEFFGYFLRIFSGYLSDKTKSPWIFTFIGYGLLLFVPMIGVVNGWYFVAAFIILERIGKAIRSPAKDTLLSSYAKVIGTGMGFAIHEFFDQIGAFAGPLIFTFALFFIKRDDLLFKYKLGFNLLWIPFILLMLILIYTFINAKDPEKFENLNNKSKEDDKDKFNKVFIFYSIFTFFTTAGFISFVLIGYYLKEKNILSDANIPLFYAIAMGVDALVALIVGKIYDILKEKKNSETEGLNLLFIIPLFTLMIPLFLFLNKVIFIILAIVFWGIVMGTHETIMKSSIADITHFKKRGLGYGVFNTIYGISIFLGSSLIGFLIKININYVLLFVLLTQVISLLIFIYIRKELNKKIIKNNF